MNLDMPDSYIVRSHSPKVRAFSRLQRFPTSRQCNEQNRKLLNGINKLISASHSQAPDVQCQFPALNPEREF